MIYLYIYQKKLKCYFAFRVKSPPNGTPTDSRIYAIASSGH